MSPGKAKLSSAIHNMHHFACHDCRLLAGQAALDHSSSMSHLDRSALSHIVQQLIAAHAGGTLYIYSVLYGARYCKPSYMAALA